MCLKSLAALDAAVGAIVARRVAAGELSESSLARRVGCSQAHLSNWSRGRRRASLAVLDDVLTALKLSPCEVLECESCPGRRTGALVSTIAAAVRCELATREDLAAAAAARPKQRRRPWRRRVDPLPEVA